jgi:O-antigen/teichoic acid export membrane protein
MYSNKYLKIYFWKILRLIIGTLSFLIVIPKISTDKNIYGIYSFCISLTIFFQYADIGFLDAGQKFASDFNSQKDLKNEIKIFSFIYFIMLIGVIVFSLCLLAIIINPNYFLNNITSDNVHLLRSLLIILIIFAPTVILQRFCQSVFSIRIEDNIYHSIDLFFNILKILSVFYFFHANKNDLLSYFLFIQLMNLFSAFTCLYIIQKKYLYDFKFLIKSFKFSRETYNKVKYLSFSSFIGTICWALFFYTDNFLIARLTSVSNMATFSIGISIITLLIGLINTIFAPFLFRFNELIVNNDLNNFYKIFNHITKTLLPIIIIPLVTLIFFTDKIIISWLGIEYYDSIIITKTLVSSLIWFSISVPFNYILISKQRIKNIYTASIILPFLYFLIIFVFFKNENIIYFSYSKSISLLVYAVYVIYSCKFFLDYHFYTNLLKRLGKLFFFILFVTTLYFYFQNKIPIVISKDRSYLFALISSIFILNLTLISFYIISDKSSRQLFLLIIRNFRK